MKNIKVEARVETKVDGKIYASTMSTGIRVSDYYEKHGHPDYEDSEGRNEDHIILAKLKKRFHGNIYSWKRI